MAPSWAGRKDGKKPPTERKPADPTKSLETTLSRLKAAVDSGAVPKSQRPDVEKQIKRLSADLPDDARARLGLEGDRDSALDKVRETGGSALGFVLRQVSRPGQAVMSGYADISRQAEATGNHLERHAGELSPGSVLKAARAGWNLQRDDTPMSISQEAGEARVARGESPRAFFGVGGDLRRNPLGAPEKLRGVSNFAFNVGGSAVLDPLTYVTAGTGRLGKEALVATEGVLGAERAAVVSQKGLSALSAAEKATLAENLTPTLYRALDRAQGGIGLRSPKALGGKQITLLPGRHISAVTEPTVGRAARAMAGTSTAQTLANVFQPRAALRRRFGDQAARHLDDARVRYQGSLNSSIEDDVATLQAAVRSARATDDELRTIVGPALDVGGSAVAVPAHLRPVVEAFDAVRQRITQSQVDAGLLTASRMHDTTEYLPRVLTPEGKAFLGSEGAGAAEVLAGGPTAAGIRDASRQARRLMPEANTAEVNEAMAGKVGGDLFETNPAKALVDRSVRANRAVASKGFVDEVLSIKDRDGQTLFRPLEDFAAPDPRLGRGGAILKAGRVRLPDGYEEINIPEVGKFAGPKELTGELTRVMKIGRDAEETRNLLRAMDKWMTLWKSYATVPFVAGLGFHERNAIGNVFNSWLAGISPADPAYARAMRIQVAMRKGKKDGDVLKYLTGTDRELADAARKYDVIGESFFNVDLPVEVGNQLRTSRRTAGEFGRAVAAKANPLSLDNAVISSGRKLGSAIESNARLAHFIAMHERLGNAADAARSVRRVLFDYSDLTPVEQKAFKRVHGFYTFTRKNLPLQVGALMSDPHKFARLQQGRTALADEAPAPEGLYPGYLAGQGAVPTSMRAGGRQVVASPDLPVVNASDTVTPLLQLLGVLENKDGGKGALRELLSNNLVGGAPGAASTAAQVASGTQFFSGAPITDKDIPSPAYLFGAGRQRIADGEKQATITQQERFILEQLLPALSKVSSAFPRGENEQDKAFQRRVSSLTGLRTYPLSEATSRTEAYQRGDIARRLLGELQAQGIEVPAASRKRAGAPSWAGRR